jgi:uncharacterized protein (DUF488 family)
MSELLTIGYEGTTIIDFVSTLRKANIKTLIDVRELPLSRKKGFSKNSLRSAVEEVGINYFHYRDLGDPKPGRDAAKSGNFDKFQEIFTKHLSTKKCQDAIDEVIPLIKNGGACLLCFERCHKMCHRTMLAEEIITRANVSIRHIGVELNAISRGKQQFRTNRSNHTN